MERARILLADDNQSFLEREISFLVPSFDIVGTAHDGQELISKAMRLAPDIVVIDITMPGCNGIEAAHRLKQAGLKAKVVFLSVHSEGDFADACLKEGALGYVVKSRMRTDLVPAIDAALHGDSFVSSDLVR